MALMILNVKLKQESLLGLQQMKNVL